MKTKGKGKAIIGIAMTAIILASVFATLVTPAAAFTRTARNVAVAATGNTIPGNIAIIGELITLDDATAVTIQLATYDGTAAKYVGTGQILTKTGTTIDTAAATTEGVYLTDKGDCLTLTNPILNAKLRIDATEVSSATSGQYVQVVMSTNLPNINYGAAGGDNDCRLVVKEGDLKTTAGVKRIVTSTTTDKFVDADADTAISIGDTWESVAGAGTGLVSAQQYSLYDADGDGAVSVGDVVISVDIPITGATWAILTGPTGLGVGDYTVYAETYRGVAAYDGKTTVKDLSVLTSAINVEADVTTQTTNNDIVLTITSGVGTNVVVKAKGASVAFNTDKGSVAPGEVTLTAVGDETYADAIPSTGKLIATITSTTTGSVTVTAAIDATNNNILDATDTTKEIIDVSFTKAVTTVDVPASFTIGDKITVSGMTTSGVDQVVIFVDDNLQKIADVKADNTYSWSWDTGAGTVPKPGSIKIKVFESRAGDTVGALNSALTASTFLTSAGTARSADTSTAILAKAGTLIATVDRTIVAKGDDVVAKGTAVGQAQVHVILINDKGVITNAVDESVLDDGSFEYTFPTTQALDAGTYKLVVISDGRDGNSDLFWGPFSVGTMAGIVNSPAGVTLGGMTLSTMTQSQLMAKIEDYTINSAGSDDLVKTLDVKIQASSVTITEVGGQAVGLTAKTVTVPVSENITLKAISNRIGGTEFMVTAENSVDPAKDLPPQTVALTDGTLTVTLDGSNAVAGSTYTIKVDDLEEASDTVTVNFETGVPVPAPTAAPTATAKPTAAPAPTAKPTAAPTAEPTATPEPPGFGAVFAIAGLLSIAYLVLRKRRE